MAKLTVVPTPVGNLEDMTFRAIRVLKEADLILAEDTRTTGILLKHFEIQNKMQSHHKFNEHKTVEQIASRIKGGENIALVSDAGTPAISDPGFMLVRECVRQGCRRGMSAGSNRISFRPSWPPGYRTKSFVSKDSFPQKKGRQTRLKELAVEYRTIIFYESPFRLVKTLDATRRVLRYGPPSIRVAGNIQAARGNRPRNPGRGYSTFYRERSER